MGIDPPAGRNTTWTF